MTKTIDAAAIATIARTTYHRYVIGILPGRPPFLGSHVGSSLAVAHGDPRRPANGKYTRIAYQSLQEDRDSPQLLEIEKRIRDAPIPGVPELHPIQGTRLPLPATPAHRAIPTMQCIQKEDAVRAS
jgi:hypothetical protein